MNNEYVDLYLFSANYRAIDTRSINLHRKFERNS